MVQTVESYLGCHTHVNTVLSRLIHVEGGGCSCELVITNGSVWVIWRTKPTQSKLGENAAGDRIHQEATTFLEEFGTSLERALPRGSKSQKRSENG